MPKPARKLAFNPPTLTKPLRPYFSHGVVARGGLVFVAGQVGTDKSGRVVSRDVGRQTEQTIKNLRAVLRHVGADLDDIVKVTVYVTDMGDFDAIARVRSKYFKKDCPASAIIEVAKLARPEFKVEIEAIAVVP